MGVFTAVSLLPAASFLGGFGIQPPLHDLVGELVEVVWPLAQLRHFANQNPLFMRGSGFFQSL